MKPQNSIRIAASLAAGALVLAACLRSAPGTPTTSPELIQTSVAQTIIAQVTQTAAAFPSTSTPAPGPVSPTATLEPPSEPTLEPTQTPLPIPTLTPTTTPQPIFSDDFSSGLSWYTDEGDDFGFQLIAGSYRMYVNILNAAIWSIRDMQFAEVRLEVDAAPISGGEDAYFGLLCRFEDQDNYYAGVVATDGYAAILKNEEGERTELSALSQVVLPEEKPIRLQLSCAGDNLTLSANGQALMAARDNDFLSGDVGLIVGTRRQGNIEVRFDNFALFKP